MKSEKNPSAFPVINLDVSKLAHKLEDKALFGLYNWRKETYAHGDMEDIWVRYNRPEEMGEKFNDEHSSVWYPILKKISEVIPICMDLMRAVDGERLGGVLITKLSSGGKIQRHTDSGWHAGYYDKYFVPIQNSKGALFCWDDVVLEPNPGEVYQFDNSVPHWVDNNSDQDRIAMIVCIRSVWRSICENV